jgi:hypothetical protein
VKMEVAPLKRRDALCSRDAADGLTRIGHMRSSSGQRTISRCRGTR